MMKNEGKSKKLSSYGLHLLVDGYGANSSKLANVNLLYNTLNQLPDRIGMHKVGFPSIIQFKEAPIAGISGFVFIVESHISIHTYSKQHFISIDVYSCRGFDYKEVIKFLKKVYGIKTMEVQVVKRGTYFPK